MIVIIEITREVQVEIDVKYEDAKSVGYTLDGVYDGIHLTREEREEAWEKFCEEYQQGLHPECDEE